MERVGRMRGMKRDVLCAVGFGTGRVRLVRLRSLAWFNFLSGVVAPVRAVGAPTRLPRRQRKETRQPDPISSKILTVGKVRTGGNRRLVRWSAVL